MPKGVVWRHEDVFYALGGGVDPTTNTRVQAPEEMVEKGRGGQLTLLPIAPLMHGATQWCVMGQSFVGNRIILVPKFDPHEVWRLVESEKVNSIMITGDAMGKPLIEALDEPGAAYDLSSLLAVTSSAALFSRAGQGRVLPPPPEHRHHRRHRLVRVRQQRDGHHDQGRDGHEERPDGQRPGRHRRLRRGPEAGRARVRASSARSPAPGDIPVGYYNDPVKTAEVFIHVDGMRYVMPGDFATIEADGTITLLGRGSVSHQLGRREDLPRGGRVGRAVAPRRVRRHRGRRPRRALGPAGGRHHPAPGRASTRRSRRSRRTAATTSPATRSPASSTWSRRIERSPSGKPDYRWAAGIVAEVPEESDSGGDRTASGS